MSPIPFILASGSPRRRELLATLGIEPTVVKPVVDERLREGEAPTAFVRRLSQEKAADVASKISSPATVLAADTVVILAADTIGIDEQGEILGKPTDAADARAMLQRLRGRTHRVCTAITLLKLGDDERRLTKMVCTDVLMRDYSDGEIRDYIASGDPFDKAGSYAIQTEAFHPVAHIDGSYTNVMGLPLEALAEALARLGVPVDDR
jgi:septum formation protein